MFKNLSTSTKLYALCTAFIVTVGVPVYVLVAEKLVAIDFARKELVGSRYLAAVREAYAATTALPSGKAPIARPPASGNAVLEALARAEAEAGTGLETRELARALSDALASSGRTRRKRSGGKGSSSMRLQRPRLWPRASATIRTSRSIRISTATTFRASSCV